MNLNVSRTLTTPIYSPYAAVAQPVTLATPVSAWSVDTVTPPTTDPGYEPPPTPFFSRPEVRVGMLLATTATAGGTAGYFVSRAAGTSLAWGAATGAVIGAALPIAALVWALRKMS
jgi:hypothetical protein